MITAKNYAAQAEKDLGYFAAKLNKEGLNADSKSSRWMQKEIREAVHFTMPNGGVIFDNDVRGLKGVEIRLPYPLITVEYYLPPLADLSDELTGSKRLIVAREVRNDPADRLKYFNDSSADIGGTSEFIIVLQCAKFIKRFNAWQPCPIAAVIPSKWDNIAGLKSESSRKDGVSIAATILTLMPGIMKNLGEREEELSEELASETVVLLELLEALSCKNVEESIHKEASLKNKQRIKSHKLPIYETKFLTLKPTVKQVSGVISTRTHASPRQHLRRGHIRRLESGNIWVNSCVVGDAERGIIDKQYKVLSK